MVRFLASLGNREVASRRLPRLRYNYYPRHPRHLSWESMTSSFHRVPTPGNHPWLFKHRSAPPQPGGLDEEKRHTAQEVIAKLREAEVARMKDLENFVDSFLAQCSQSNSELVFLQRRPY
jgi:hypothetical protein